MKNIMLSLVLALTCAIITNVEAVSKRPATLLHVVAYNSKDQGPLGVDALSRSAKVCKIKYDELSSGTTSEEVLRSILNYLKYKKFRSSDVILVVDRNKTVFLSDPEDILEKFLKLNKPYLMSTSKKQPGLLNPIQAYLPPPPVKTAFSWLNTRLFMGRVGDITKLMTRVLMISQQQPEDSNVELSDLFNYDFFYNQPSYALDYGSEIFLSLYGITVNDITQQKQSRNRLLVNTSNGHSYGPKIVSCEPGQRGGGDVLNTIYIANFG